MKSKKRLLFLLLLFISLFGTVIFAWKKFGKDEKAERYDEVQVKRGDIKISVLATGKVQPENRLVIKPPINGRIETLLVHEGAKVKKGQTLAWMSSSDRAALLDVASAKGNQELSYWKDIYKPAPITAFIDGEIISQNVEPGQMVSTPDTIFVMSDRLVLSAQVDETDISKIFINQKVEITLDAYPQEMFQGRVHQIAFDARIANNVTVYDVEIIPEKTPSFMRSGMTANITFASEERLNILQIPVEAVKRSEGKSSVLISPKAPNEEGAPGRKPSKEPQSVEVTLGLSDGKSVEVLSGVSEDETVLISRKIPLKGSSEEKKKNPFMPSRPH